MIEMTPQEVEAAQNQAAPEAVDRALAPIPDPTCEQILAAVETPPCPAPKAKQCDIAIVISPTVLELLQLAPANLTIRTQVHAELRVPLPEAAQTFEQIKVWVEANVAPRPEQLEIIRLKQEADRAAAERRARNSPAFSICVREEGREYGKCRYSVSTSGSVQYPILPSTIDEALQDYETIEALVRHLKTWAVDNAEVCQEWDGTPEYEEHDSEETETNSTTVDTDALEEQLKAWLQAHRPEAYEQLVD